MGRPSHRGSGRFLTRLLAVAATAGLATAGAVAVSVAPAAAATRAYGFEGSTGWLGTVTAGDGTLTICVNPIGLFPSGTTTYVGLTDSIAQQTAANNGGHGGTAYTSGAAIQKLNYAEGVWVNTTDNVIAAGLDLFAYSLDADYPGPVGSSTNLNYYSQRAGSSAAAVRAAEAMIAAQTEANYNTPVESSAAQPVIDIDDTSLQGTVTVSVTPVTSTGTLTLTGATQTGTGSTVIPVSNGQVVTITATPTPDAATGFTVTASVTWTVPTTPLPELREYHTDTPRYAQIDEAPAGYDSGTISNEETQTDPLPNTFAPVVSTNLTAEFFDPQDPISDLLTAHVASGSGPWHKDGTGSYIPIVATGTWYRELAGTPTGSDVPSAAVPVATETFTLNGPGQYSVTGPIAADPGIYTVVWSIQASDQPRSTQSFMPPDYDWRDQFAQIAETGSARSRVVATTATSSDTQGLNVATSDTLTPHLGDGTMNWPLDLEGNPVAVAFFGKEFWIAGDTAPTEQPGAPTDAVEVSSVTLTATSLAPLNGPDQAVRETTDGYFVWQWSVAQSDYVDAWTEAFAEPTQITRVLAPTMVTSADPTVALTDPASDTVTISGPPMGFVANLTWAAYGQVPGIAPTCDDSNESYDSSSTAVKVAGAGEYAPPTPPIFAAEGVYLWVATLRDDHGAVIAQGGCGDAGERTNVESFSLNTVAMPVANTRTAISDAATIAGPTPAGSTLRFAAYKTTTGTPSCETSDLAYVSGDSPLTGSGLYRSDSVVLPVGTYWWVATTYDKHGNVLQTGTCGDPSETSNVLSGLAFTGKSTSGNGSWLAFGLLLLGGCLVVGSVLWARGLRGRKEEK